MRKHVTFSNVIAMVALFAVLGGTAIAAAIVDEPSDLGKGVVVNKKIKKGTIKKNRLSKKAINQLKGQQGEKGAKGETGETGPSNSISFQSNAISLPQDSNVQQSIAATLDLEGGKSYIWTARFVVSVDDFNAIPTCGVATPIGTDPLLDNHDSVTSSNPNGAPLQLDVGDPGFRAVLTGATKVDADNPSLVLHCDTDVAASSVDVTNLAFTATEVGNLTILP